MKKQNWYGLLGFLSLLGWIGVFTQERVFLLFFAFAVDFQYFFLPSDEMLEESMARCAARGFLFGVLSMAAAVLLGMAVWGIRKKTLETSYDVNFHNKVQLK